MLRAKRRQSHRMAKRRGLVDTMRRTALNELMRRRASDPLQPLATPYLTLSDVLADARARTEAARTALARAARKRQRARTEEGAEVPSAAQRREVRQQLQRDLTRYKADEVECEALLERYKVRSCSATPWLSGGDATRAMMCRSETIRQRCCVQPATPGMVIDGAFVPASKRQLSNAAAAEPPGEAPTTEQLAAWRRTPVGATYVKAATGALPTSRALRQRLRDAAAPPGVLGSAADALEIAREMHHPVRRKMRRLAKWLDDEWLKGRIVPDTTQDRLVLPNGMVLHSKSMTQPRSAPASVGSYPLRLGPAGRAERHARRRARPPGVPVSLAPGRDEAAREAAVT